MKPRIIPAPRLPFLAIVMLKRRENAILDRAWKVIRPQEVQWFGPFRGGNTLLPHSL